MSISNKTRPQPTFNALMPGITPKKEFGQNFLTDETVLERIINLRPAGKQKYFRNWWRIWQFN